MRSPQYTPCAATKTSTLRIIQSVENVLAIFYTQMGRLQFGRLDVVFFKHAVVYLPDIASAIECRTCL